MSERVFKTGGGETFRSGWISSRRWMAPRAGSPPTPGSREATPSRRHQSSWPAENRRRPAARDETRGIGRRAASSSAAATRGPREVPRSRATGRAER
jgi:hypothetical protein